MQASLRSIRIAPKKAQLVAKMIRGQSVPDAMYTLEHTNKKAARIFENLLRSAMANASHNEKQDPQMMVIKLLTVNKAQAYHRGVPMARGRVRPMRKFMSHINMTLGVAGEALEKNPKKPKSPKSTSSDSSDSLDSLVSSKNASQTAKKTVKKTTTMSKKASTSTKGKSTTDTTTSTSKSSVSKKSPQK
ncbi:MAG: 50S ribosomal protein L22 [bacterium]|nr:50S ribosomal protein L22 [bacterium]